jgi:hypothetical protein
MQAKKGRKSLLLAQPPFVGGVCRGAGLHLQCAACVHARRMYIDAFFSSSSSLTVSSLCVQLRQDDTSCKKSSLQDEK